jgi:hypothetical protein
MSTEPEETNPFASADAPSRKEDLDSEEEEEKRDVAKDEGALEACDSDDEGDPDLLAFHNKAKSGDEDAGEAAAAPSPAPAATPPPIPARGGTPIGRAVKSGVEGRSTPVLQDWLMEPVVDVPAPRATTGGVNRGGMEWITTQHLDLTPVRAGTPAVQAHCAAFHHTQALFAAAIGRTIIGTLIILEIVNLVDPELHNV